ncbi:hypothetical protein TWF506_006909 [Arthrobotrys conoides]|uniref:Uncharacterized protein n=1 Tax=Arthrobotrys conoides TaxID=74498 RepID=A0AAN8NHM1_9PEZI
MNRARLIGSSPETMMFSPPPPPPHTSHVETSAKIMLQDLIACWRIVYPAELPLFLNYSVPNRSRCVVLDFKIKGCRRSFAGHDVETLNPVGHFYVCTVVA